MQSLKQFAVQEVFPAYVLNQDFAMVADGLQNFMSKTQVIP